ncbi:MAG: permease [Proteobacteria bacterium]|nr:permease [Pseudomonadota bacterium]
MEKERYKLLILVAAFLACWFLPVGWARFDASIIEALALVKWYAREHVILCLIPAFFIAGAISAFVSRASVVKYLGAKANKLLAYSVASVSGTILAVCSCTVLPLFMGIYRRGAGLGPAVAFLYSGPAINVLAIILTARVLGLELGVARAIGAVLFGVVIGILMHLIFLKEERSRHEEGGLPVGLEGGLRPLWQEGLFFASMVAFLVFANWGRPQGEGAGAWQAIFALKWYLAAASLVALALSLASWFRREELVGWAMLSWNFAKQILPLLLVGVAVSGLLLGRPGHEGLIPSRFIEGLLGGNSLRANAIASVAGAFMYFATLTEVPILQGLIGSGMGKGPALALLLAGPALSLPSMLVIRSVMGTKRTAVYVLLVVLMATGSGMLYGHLFG